MTSGVVARTAYAGAVPDPTLDALLDAAVSGIGGSIRDGQVRMAHAVAEAIADQEHLLVQAGTGTGKSLGYLVPAVHHAMATGQCAVIATATPMPRSVSRWVMLLGSVGGAGWWVARRVWCWRAHRPV